MFLTISTYFTAQMSHSLTLLLTTNQPLHLFSLEVKVPSAQIWKSWNRILVKPLGTPHPLLGMTYLSGLPRNNKIGPKISHGVILPPCCLYGFLQALSKVPPIVLISMFQLLFHPFHIPIVDVEWRQCPGSREKKGVEDQNSDPRMPLTLTVSLMWQKREIMVIHKGNSVWQTRTHTASVRLSYLTDRTREQDRRNTSWFNVSPQTRLLPCPSYRHSQAPTKSMVCEDLVNAFPSTRISNLGKWVYTEESTDRHTSCTPVASVMGNWRDWLQDHAETSLWDL